MVRISELIKKFKIIADTHPNINDFGVGPEYELSGDINNYPYLWITTDETHSIEYSENGGYKNIEFDFIFRVGDKVNNQTGYNDSNGINSSNGMDISSDTFSILLDIINTISNDNLGLFDNINLIGDLTIEPFFNNDNGDVNGNESVLTFRVKNDNTCINPLTDNINEL